MTRDYCTYFDSAYFSRGLALYRSMKAHCAPFRLFVLCLDDECFARIASMRLPEVVPVRLAELEAADPALAETKKSRSRVEYYFTCSPCFPLHVFRTHPGVERLTYLDADLFFFSSPEPVFAEIGESPIAIVPHRIAPSHAHFEKANGVYNVGWITFVRSAEGLACLEWWRERCLEWCSVRPDATRYADQKYLDQWPGLFKGVAVLSHKGANLAPWNVANYRVAARGGRVTVDGGPLVFYHFHAFGRINGWLYATHFGRYGTKAGSAVVRGIYRPYMRALEAAEKEGDPVPAGPAGSAPVRAPFSARLFRKARRAVQIAASLASREYLLRRP
jgi:hypothetical protein